MATTERRTNMGEWSFAPGVIATYLIAIGGGVLVAYLLRFLSSSKSPKLFVSLIKENYGPWQWQAHFHNEGEEEIMASGKARGYSSAIEALSDARRTFLARAVFEGD